MNLTTASKNKIILLLFFLILVAPVFYAYHLVKHSDVKNFRMTNHGELITPPINISQTSLFDIAKKQSFSGETLQGKWWLVYVSPSRCQETCHDVIYNMRQIRTALGKESSRVERLFLAHPQCETSVCETYLSESYPDMLRAKLSPTDFASLFGSISKTQERESVGEIYIIDPKGNIMMQYTVDTESRGILADVKRLLKVSKMG